VHYLKRSTMRSASPSRSSSEGGWLCGAGKLGQRNSRTLAIRPVDDDGAGPSSWRGETASETFGNLAPVTDSRSRFVGGRGSGLMVAFPTPTSV
jgi:hypothetical protein